MRMRGRRLLVSVVAQGSTAKQEEAVEMGDWGSVEDYFPEEPSELHAAVRKGDLAAVDALLACAAGEDLLAAMSSGRRTPLHDAVLLGVGENEEVCEAMLRLLSTKAEERHWLAQDDGGSNVLHFACQGDNPAVVELVLQHMPPEGFTHSCSNRTPAIEAFRIHHSATPVVRALPWKALVAKGGGVDDNCVNYAVRLLGDQILGFVLDLAPPDDDLAITVSPPSRGGENHKYLSTILYAYVWSRFTSAEGMALLLDRVPNLVAAVGYGGQTPLHACRDPEAAAVLLERMTPEQCEIQDIDGNTALHLANIGELALMIAQRMREESLAIVNLGGGTALQTLLAGPSFEGENPDEALVWLVRHMSEEALTRADGLQSSAILAAAGFGCLAVLKVLVEVLPEAALLVVNKYGNALHACLEGLFEQRRSAADSASVLEILLSRLPKAYRTMANKEGATPAHLAAEVDAEMGTRWSQYFVTGAKGAVS